MIVIKDLICFISICCNESGMIIQVKCFRFALSAKPVVGSCLGCIEDVIYNNCTSALYCLEKVFNPVDFAKCVYDACGAPMCKCFFECVLPAGTNIKGNLDMLSYTFDINAKLILK